MSTAIGTAVGWVLQDMQGFQLIMNFIVLPLFFFSKRPVSARSKGASRSAKTGYKAKRRTSGNVSRSRYPSTARSVDPAARTEGD